MIYALVHTGMPAHFAGGYIFILTLNYFMKNDRRQSGDVMRTYSSVCRFTLLIHMFVLLPICLYALYAYSIILSIKQTSKRKYKGNAFVVNRKLQISTVQMSNVKFMEDVFVSGSIIICLTWLWVLLCVSGDVHPNPRPSSTSSLDSSSVS